MQRDGPVRTVRNRHAASTAAVTADVRLHLASVIQAGPENSVKNVFAIHGNNLQRIFKRSTTLPPPSKGIPKTVPKNPQQNQIRTIDYEIDSSLQFNRD